MRHCGANVPDNSSIPSVALPAIRWGEDRVYFHNQEQQLIALPASWTDVVAADPLVSIAEGRAWFRAEDLFEWQA